MLQPNSSRLRPAGTLGEGPADAPVVEGLWRLGCGTGVPENHDTCEALHDTTPSSKGATQHGGSEDPERQSDTACW